MTVAIPKDLALSALQEAARTVPQLSCDLISCAYEIEKSHQFDEGREAPLRLLQKLVEEFVALPEASQ